MSIPVTAVLSVSRKQPLNCDELAKDLYNAGIFTNVVKNTTYTDTKEYGCRLTQTVTKKKELEMIWNMLRPKYGFQCAHLKLGDCYQGCILDYLPKTNCPH
jgi:hypothetical protein